MPYAPNQAMRKAAQTAIEYNRRVSPSRRWGTQTGKVRAQQIAQGKELSADVILRMYSYLSRARPNYEAQRDSKNYGKAYYAYLGWGGETALAWAEDKLNKLRRAGEI